MMRQIPPKEAAILLEKGEAVLIDVREQNENAECRIEGAKLIPVNSISHEGLEKFAGKKIIFHCNGGGRGGRTCAKFADKFDTYNLEGGIKAWEAAGFKVLRNIVKN